MSKELIVVGKIINSQGNKGEVQVTPLTDNPRRFEKLKHIYLVQDTTELCLSSIDRVWYHKSGRVILKLGGCNSINDAKALINSELAVAQEDVVKLPEDTYFQFQIVGLDAFTCDGEYLGQVKEIFPTGSNDVYVIKNGDQECLVPAIKEVVCQVDLENKKLILKLPEGLR